MLLVIFSVWLSLLGKCVEKSLQVANMSEYLGPA
jgi:hypothetical protein